MASHGSLLVFPLGSFLCGEDKPEWEDALARLKTIPLTETLKILELSYITLEDDYKEIFLDAACIMKGCIKHFAIQVLESFGFHGRIGLRVLQQKSLITIYKDNYYGECLDMHDSIQEMGRHIVRHSHPDLPKNHSRLWKNDEIEHILANDSGTEETRCIEFYSTKLNPYMLIKGLGKMKALRYLSVVTTNHLRDAELDTFSPSFPDALRYLKWDSYPFRSLPETFQANNLVRLEMPTSEIVQLWEGGEKKVLDKLRFLDFRERRIVASENKVVYINKKITKDMIFIVDEERWSALDLRKPTEVRKLVSSMYHALGACLRLYRDFLSLQMWLGNWG